MSVLKDLMLKVFGLDQVFDQDYWCLMRVYVFNREVSCWRLTYNVDDKQRMLSFDSVLWRVLVLVFYELKVF